MPPFLKPLLGATLAALGLWMSFRAYGWPGLWLFSGAVLMWLLVHYTRMMKVLQRAAHRPVGTVDSAVMLNAKLSPKMSLLHTIGFTRSLGQPVAVVAAAQPGPPLETFVWTDASGCSVTVEYRRGKAHRWQLTRPDSGT